jgi:hypothetical protein
VAVEPVFCSGEPLRRRLDVEQYVGLGRFAILSGDEQRPEKDRADRSVLHQQRLQHSRGQLGGQLGMVRDLVESWECAELAHLVTDPDVMSHPGVRSLKRISTALAALEGSLGAVGAAPVVGAVRRSRNGPGGDRSIK